MEDLPLDLAYGAKYDPAMSIRTQAAADAYFELLVRHCMAVYGKDRAEAEQIERGNLGYYAGYFDTETRLRVEEIFRCAHPFFGAIAERGIPTNEEAFQMGVDYARKHFR